METRYMIGETSTIKVKEEESCRKFSWLKLSKFCC